MMTKMMMMKGKVWLRGQDNDNHDDRGDGHDDDDDENDDDDDGDDVEMVGLKQMSRETFGDCKWGEDRWMVSI